MDCGLLISVRGVSLLLLTPLRRRSMRCVLLAAVAWCAATATARAAGPVDTTPPSLVGIAQQGQTLALTRGMWTDATAVTLADVWESCAGASCSAISPQPAAASTLTAADVGRSIEVIETATATDGTTTATSTPPATAVP